MEGQVVLHFDVFNAEGGSGYDFVGFLLKERGRKRAAGFTLLVRKNEIWVGFPFRGKAWWVGRGEGKSEWFRGLVREEGWGVSFLASSEGSGGLGFGGDKPSKRWE